MKTILLVVFLLVVVSSFNKVIEQNDRMIALLEQRR